MRRKDEENLRRYEGHDNNKGRVDKKIWRRGGGGWGVKQGCVMSFFNVYIADMDEIKKWRREVQEALR